MSVPGMLYYISFRLFAWNTYFAPLYTFYAFFLSTLLRVIMLAFIYIHMLKTVHEATIAGFSKARDSIFDASELVRERASSYFN